MLCEYFLCCKVAFGSGVLTWAPLYSIESMKMETVIRSPQDGVVKKLTHKEGVSCPHAGLSLG